MFGGLATFLDSGAGADLPRHARGSAHTLWTTAWQRSVYGLGRVTWREAKLTWREADGETIKQLGREPF